jgi:predicted amidohydrolase YtcJ
VHHWLPRTYWLPRPYWLLRSIRVSATSAIPVLLCYGVLHAHQGLTQTLGGSQPEGAASVVITDARIYRGASLPAAQAMAVGADRIVFIGSNQEAAHWIRPSTRVLHMGGARVLPGLVDAHIHPLDIVDLDFCDLDSKPVTLRELSGLVRQCIVRYKTPPGGRLIVHQWNYTGGNQPDADYPTLRAALDKASSGQQVQLLGNDGHHGAFNSLELASAKNAAGRTVGLSKASLETDFAEYKKFVGVDERGEPNGAANENARYLMNPNSMLNTDLDDVMKAPQRIPERLNSVGITAILDAMTAPDTTALFDALAQRGQLTFRASLAQFYDPAQFHTADGQVDYDAMVSKAIAIRAKFASHPLIRADFIKLFADGVIEGNPYAVPPTLPNGAALKDFLQPIFVMDAKGLPTVVGYVDGASSLCTEVRANPASYADAGIAARFLEQHGYHPAQCTASNGELQHERAVILEFVRRFHQAGFNMHIHVIGDRALRTALDAIEAARQADGNSATHDSLAHIQLSAPEDVARIGRDHLYVAWTFAWMAVDPGYDMTVIPFLEKVHGNGYRELHAPDSFYEANAYPVRAVQSAGGITAAGSDAPVETRDPRPFVNMAHAITRRHPGGKALNSGQDLTVDEAIAAYTINGARMLGIDQDAGSLDVGKSADFIVLDRDIVRMAADGRADEIAKTRVMQTWFRGRQVYARPGTTTERVIPRGASPSTPARTPRRPPTTPSPP